MLITFLLIFVGLALIVWAANTAMIHPRLPASGWGTVATANTAKDGTGTVVTIFTADAANGSRIDFIRIKPLGTNIATVIRIFINNGLTNVTAANNSLWTELTIPATTLTEIAANTEMTIPMDIPLKPGYKLNVTLGTTIAAGVQVTAVGGDY